MRTGRIASGRRWGRRQALGLAGGASAAAFLAACGSSDDNESSSNSAPATAQREAGVVSNNQNQAASAETPKPGGSLTYYWPLTPPLDPVPDTTYTTHRLASFVYPRLLKFKTDTDPKTASNYEVVPDLAAAMPEVLDDGTRYVFKIRPDAKSHNKAPLNGRLYNAEDVKASYDRFSTEQKNTNRGVFQQAGLQSVETPDANTVVFKLAKPFAPFLSALANPQYLWILPKEAASGGFDTAKDMIGAGPFMFDSIQPDVAIKFRKHPDYYFKGQPYVDNLTISIIPETSQQLAQYQAEKLDLAMISHEFIADLKKSSPKSTIVKFPSGTLPFLFTQQRGNGPFKDERVRQALSLAVDRDALLGLTWGGEGWWQNMVPTHLGRWWTDPKDKSNPSVKWFGTGDHKKDLAEAVALLKAAGYDENKKIPIKYYYTPNGYTERYNQWAEATMGMIKETNIFNPTAVTADYRGEWIVSGGILFGKIPDDGVAFALQSGFPDAHDYTFNPLHSKSTRNHAGINDAEIDALIDKESVTLNDTERVKAIHAVIAKMNEKALYAPLMIGPDYWVSQGWVRNFTLGQSYGWGAEIFSNLWISK